METRHIATLSLLMLTLGMGCYDPDKNEVQPQPAGPTAEGETSGGGSDEDEGDEGDEGDGSDSSEPPPSNDPGPICDAEIGEPCGVNGDCCDFNSGDALCVNDGVNTICHQTCTSNSECGSGCCGETTSGEGICVAEVYCDVCEEPGNTCNDNGDCCGFEEGTTSCVNFPVEGLYCSATCIWNSDCNSGCCVPLDTGLGACAPDDYCADASGGGFEPGTATPRDAAALVQQMTLR